MISCAVFGITEYHSSGYGVLWATLIACGQQSSTTRSLARTTWPHKDDTYQSVFDIVDHEWVGCGEVGEQVECGVLRCQLPAKRCDLGCPTVSQVSCMTEISTACAQVVNTNRFFFRSSSICVTNML